MIAIPGDWQMTESENENGLTLDLICNAEQIPLGYTFLARTEE